MIYSTASDDAELLMKPSMVRNNLYVVSERYLVMVSVQKHSYTGVNIHNQEQAAGKILKKLKSFADSLTRSFKY